MVVLTLLILSVSLQCIAAYLALRLAYLTVWRTAWFLIAGSIVLMAARRSITLVGIFSGEMSQPSDLVAEGIALAISILLVAGLARFSPLFLAGQRADEALREREHLLHLFVEHSPAAIAMFDREMRYAAVSRRWLSDFKLPDREIIGRSHYDVFPEIPLRWKEVHQRCLAGAIERCEEESFLRADGSTDWVRWEVRPWLQADGEIGGIIMFVEVITERKRVEERLRKSETLLTEAQRVAHLGNWNWEIPTNVITWSEEMYHIFGLRPEKAPIAHETFLSRIHPEDREDVNRVTQQALKDHQPFDHDRRVVWPDGTIHIYHSRGAVEIDAGGKPLRMYGTAQDITEHTRAEQSLRESEERLRQAIRVSDIGIFDHDHRADTIYWSPMQRTIFGWGPDEPVALQGFLATVYPDDHARITAAVRGSHDPSGNGLYDVEHRIIRRDGRVRWLSARGQTFFEGEGSARRPVRTVGANIDITDRKRAEEEGRESEAFISSVLEHLPMMVFVKDARDLKFVRFNKAGEELLGYPREAMLGKSDHDFFPKEQADSFTAKDREVLHSGRLTDIPEEPVRTQDKGVRILHTKKIPIADETGAPRYLLGISEDITERKRAEEAVRESEARYRNVVELSPEAIFINQGGRIVFANPACLRLLGAQTADQVIGKSPFEFVHPDYHEEVRGLIRKLLEGGGPTPLIERQWIRLDGTPLNVEVTSSTLPYEGGTAIQVLARDITKRKRVEEALRESEERFRASFKNAAVGMGLVALSGRFVETNRALSEITGYSEEELKGLTFTDITHPDDRTHNIALYQKMLEGEREGVVIEKRYCRKDGSIVWVTVSVGAICDLQGNVTHTIGLIEDITERKRAEEALRESSQFNQQIITNAREGIIVYDRDGRYMVWNPFMEELSGLSAGTVLGKRPTDLSALYQQGRGRLVMEYETMGRIEAAVKRSMAGETFTYLEIPFVIKPTGATGWTSVRYGPFRNAEGEIVGVIATVWEITEHKRAEEALRASEERLGQAIRVSDIGIFDHDHRTEAIYWSPVQRRIYGWGQDEPVTLQGFLACVYPEDARRITAAVRRAHDPAGDGAFDVEHRTIRRNGEIRWVATRSQTYFEGEGGARRPVRTVGAVVDITERKRAEEALREHAERLQMLSRQLVEAQEAEGRRIGRELHDDLGQILTSLKIYLQTLPGRSGAALLKKRKADSLALIDQAVERVRNLSADLHPTVLDDLGLAAALRWMLDRQARQAGFKAKFVARGMEERLPPEIETTCFRIAQEALTNVVRHAKAKTVRLELSRKKDGLHLLVSDDGVGFDSTAARAEALRGKSLGLIGMEERAAVVKGWVDIRSKPGQGTELSIHIPLSETVRQPPGAERLLSQ